MATPTAHEYAHAADKHLADAITLLQQGRHDGAGYLAGYVAECGYKALLILAGRHAGFIHDLGQLHGLLMRFANNDRRVAPYAKRVRQPFPYMSADSIRDYSSTPLGWSESLRYFSPGAQTPVTAKEWVESAKKFHGTTVHAMRKDGSLE